MEMCGWRVRKFSKKRVIAVAFTVALAMQKGMVFAQDGAAGIKAADDKVRGYFGVGTNLMYAVGAVLGLVGAIKVYQKWNAGEPDTLKTASAWFGSCIFLVVVATIISSFFGVG